MAYVSSFVSVSPASRLGAVPPYLFARFDRLIAARRHAGVEVVSLAMGDPDLSTFPEIIEAGAAALRDPCNLRYPSNRGRFEFREAVAGFYRRRFGVELDPEREVIPVLGAKECLANLCLAFVDPGSAAIVPDPGYPLYRVDAQLAGGDIVDLPLRSDQGFAPDYAALGEEDLSRARVLFVNYPNNPTGAIAGDDVFERAVALAQRYRLLLVSDNAYSEVTYDGYRAPSLLASAGARDVGVEVFSFSKAFNMAGWRCGALVGNPDVLEHFWRLKSNVDQGMFEVVQLAGARALQPDLDIRVRDRNNVYRRRRDLVVDALSAGGCAITPPRATMYVWAPVPAGFETSASFSETVLEQAGVLVTPGSAYGAGGEGWFRVSLGCPDAQLAQALDRLTGLELSWRKERS